MFTWLRTVRGGPRATTQPSSPGAPDAAGDGTTASAKDRDQRALDVVLAEYQFVESLIPLYRGVETTVLGGTGLIVSGVVAALSALESADTPKTAAEGILLSAGAWAPVVLLLIEVMALTRIARASAYIADHLHPLACELGGNSSLLRWEVAPSHYLLKRIADARARSAGTEASRVQRPLLKGARALVEDRVVRLSASSTPVIVTVALVSVVLASAGAIVYPTPFTIVSGILAVGAALAGAGYGIEFSRAHEGRGAFAED